MGFATGGPFMIVAALFGLSGDLGTFRTLSLVGVLITVPSLLTAFAVERRTRRTRDRARMSGTD